MDEPMDKKGKKGKNRPSDDGPSYMQPREPVLEEPLMGEEREVEESEQNVEDESLGDQNQAARESLSMGIEGEGAKQAKKEVAPTSPYFPRGIYEDAWAVEAYYGRGEEQKGN